MKKEVKILEEVKNQYNKKLLDRYLMLCKSKGLTEQSIKAFRTDLILFMRFIGDKNVDEVSHIDVEDFLAYCMNERHNQPDSLNRKYISINMFYKTLLKKEYLPITCRNPMDRVDKAKERKKMREPLTHDDVAKIFKYVDEINDLRSGAMFSLFLESGIRLSELWQLNKNSLDFHTNSFQVLGKGMKPRDCIFGDNTKERVLKYLESRTDDLEALFVSRNHKRLSKKSIERVVKDICERSGISERVFPHRLRHTAGNTARNNNVKIEDIQLFLGHSSPDITAKIYARGNLMKVQNQFSNMFDDVMNIEKEEDDE